MSKLEEAKQILQDLEMPAAQCADICCWSLLAMSNIKENSDWSDAENEWIRIHDIIEFTKTNYGVEYAEKLCKQANVNIKVTYGEEKKYSITYQKGRIQAEGEEIKEDAQYKDTELHLKECTWKSDNYIFKEWKAYYLTVNAQDDQKKDTTWITITDNTIIVPPYDVTIVATWNKIASYDWVLVTDASTLKAGDYVVIASNTQGKVASNTITSSVMGEIDATFTDDYGYLKSVPTGTAVLTRTSRPVFGKIACWRLYHCRP